MPSGGRGRRFAPRHEAPTDPAGDANYDFLEMSAIYADYNIVDFNQSGEGFRLRYSVDFDNGAIFTAFYDGRTFGEIDTFDVEQGLWSVGLGYHLNVKDLIDLYGTLSYSGINTTIAGDDVADGGIDAVVGVRTLVFNNNFEFDVYGRYIEYDDPIRSTLSESTVTAEARWHFNDTLSFALGTTIAEDSSALFFNVRANLNEFSF